MAARGSGHASGPVPVSLVCCGFVGTLVADNGMIDRAFAEAIATQGVVTGTAAYARCMALVHQTRGQAAADVLQVLFPDSEVRGQAAHMVFDRACLDAIGRTSPAAIPGAEAALDQLADAGFQLCLISGFSRRVLAAMLDTLGWWDRFNLTLCPDDVRRGLPWPDLVLSAMLQGGVTEVRETAVVQSMESGVLCGYRSGAGLVAGVLTGTHTRERLKRAGATHLIPSIADLPPLLGPVGGPAAAAATSTLAASRIPADSRAANTAES